MQPNQDFLKPKPQTKEEYYASLRKQFPEYFALTKYQRKCLCATNYWRVVSGLPVIKVPKEDVHYYNYFNENCYKIREIKDKIERNAKQVR